MPNPHNMARRSRELYGEDIDVVIPRLMLEMQTPFRVALQLGVAPNAVRNWLINNDWAFDGAHWVKLSPLEPLEIKHA